MSTRMMSPQSKWDGSTLRTEIASPLDKHWRHAVAHHLQNDFVLALQVFYDTFQGRPIIICR